MSVMMRKKFHNVGLELLNFLSEFMSAFQNDKMTQGLADILSFF
jgi:hypothetical protein